MRFRQLYLVRNVDALKRDGKVAPDIAARIRNKPMKVIGWGSVCVGVAFFVQTLFTRLP